MNIKRVLYSGVFMAMVSVLAVEPAASAKKVLVFSVCEGFNHKASIAECKEMAAEAKNGAFAVGFPDDYGNGRVFHTSFARYHRAWDASDTWSVVGSDWRTPLEQGPLLGTSLVRKSDFRSSATAFDGAFVN